MKKRAVLPLAIAAALAACDDPMTTGDTLSAAEAAELSEAMIQSSFDATGEVATTDAAAASVDGTLQATSIPLTSTFEFTLTRSCLVGGQVVIAGTIEREWDRESHSGSSDLSVTKTHEQCARPLRNSDVVITLQGAPNIAVEAHHAWDSGHRSGLQTMDMEGAVDWATDDDREGTCEIDIAVTFDPETRTRTVSGTFCDRTIDHTTTWHHDGMAG